ncbi:hypothetical protein B0H13DRAFT_2569041, partial [Mycena leptocephala]
EERARRRQQSACGRLEPSKRRDDNRACARHRRCGYAAVQLRTYRDTERRGALVPVPLHIPLQYPLGPFVNKSVFSCTLFSSWVRILCGVGGIWGSFVSAAFSLLRSGAAWHRAELKEAGRAARSPFLPSYVLPQRWRGRHGCLPDSTRREFLVSHSEPAVRNMIAAHTFVLTNVGGGIWPRLRETERIYKKQPTRLI